MCIDNFFKNLLQLLFTNKEVYLKNKLIARNASINKSQILWKDLIKEETSYVDSTLLLITVPSGISLLQRTLILVCSLIALFS